MEEPFVVVDEAFRQSAEGGFYDAFYAQVSEDFLAWRERGAIAKCRTIEALAKGLDPESVLEVGAGTCSVLARLAELGFARRFFALETSPSAVEHIRSRVRFAGFAGVYLADSTHTGLSNDAFDLGILSHVLEHVRDPVAVLRETMRLCRFVVLEVPLEDSLLGAIDWLFRERILGAERGTNPSGHIQFFNLHRVRELVTVSGGRRIRDRAYRPSLDRGAEAAGGPVTSLALIRHRLSELAFASFGPRVILTNYAALVQRINP